MPETTPAPPKALLSPPTGHLTRPMPARASGWPAPCARAGTTRSTTPSGWPEPGTPGRTFRSRCAVGCADFEGTPARTAH